MITVVNDTTSEVSLATCRQGEVTIAPGTQERIDPRAGQSYPCFGWGAIVIAGRRLPCPFLGVATPNGSTVTVSQIVKGYHMRVSEYEGCGFSD